MKLKSKNNKCNLYYYVKICYIDKRVDEDSLQISSDVHRLTSLQLVSERAAVGRRRRVRVNILITFWAWLAELASNTLLLLAMGFLFGADKFLHEMVMLASTGDDVWFLILITWCCY